MKPGRLTVAPRFRLPGLSLVRVLRTSAEREAAPGPQRWLPMPGLERLGSGTVSPAGQGTGTMMLSARLRDASHQIPRLVSEALLVGVAEGSNHILPFGIVS